MDPRLDGNANWVLGIGASAGGLEALTLFVSNLPSTFAGSIIVAQHLAPHARSMMVELLQRHTTLKIVSPNDDQVIEADSIYIAPPNRDIAILNHKIHLTAAGDETRPKPSVNAFFESLARAYGHRAVGIVLSGTGSDGSEGVQAIKAAGGLTIAQDDVTAKYDGMPRAAVLTGEVDVILPPNLIARDIEKLLKDHSGQNSMTKLDHGGLKKILRLVRDSQGTDFRQYKPSTIQRRAAKQMVAIGVKTYDEYYEILLKTPGEVSKLAQEMLVSVTSFFRDPDVFQALTETISKIVAKKNSHEDLRVWDAGCATGEEAYTIAILIFEAMERQKKPLALKIFATDLDQEAIVEARAGYYTDLETEKVPQELLTKYFERRDGGYEVNKRIRDAVVFARQDMTQNAPFVKLDIISCRNVLIYFDQELQKKVIEIFHYALLPSGTLLLGKSESVPVVSNLFKTVDRSTKLYAKLNVPSQTLHTSAGAQRAIPNLPLRRKTSALTLAEQSYLRLLNSYEICGVTIDENCVILQVIGDVSPYLGFFNAQPDFRLTNLLPKGIGVEIPLLIRKAMKDGTAQKSRAFKKEKGQKGDTYNIVLRPLNPDEMNDTNAKRLFIVNFEAKKRDEKFKTAALTSDAEPVRISELEQDLFLTREHLQTVIEELGVSNEDLQTVNEELSATNEELQASTEELETTNEELQSSNEELTTLNEELNAKQSELRFLNVSFENVQNSIGSALVILDNNMRVVRYNPEALKLFALGPNDIGREISRVSSNFEIEDFDRMVVSAIGDGISSETIAVLGAAFYQLRILPCLDENRSITGAILIFFDDTLSLKNQEKLALSDRRMGAIINGSESLISLKDSWGRYLLVNDAFRSFFKLSDEQIIQKTDRELFSEQLAVRTRELDVEVLVTRSSRKSRVETLSPDGAKHFFVESRFPLFELDKNQAYAVGCVANDVTAEALAAQELESSQARYRAIVEDQAVFVARHDTHGILNYVNEPFVEQFGQSNVGLPFESIVSSIDKPRVAEAINGITLANPIAQYEHRVSSAPANALKWFKWIHRGIFGQDGRIKEYQAVGFDVSESRYKTDQLMERDSVYSSVFDHTSDFLSVYRVKDDEFILESFNRTTANAMGISRTQMVGKSLREFVDPERVDAVVEKYRRAVMTRAAQSLDEQMEMPGGARYFATTLVPIPGASGEIERVAATSRDISNYKRIEADLRRAKDDAESANKAKSDFLASMSHELRTPLNVVLGMSQLLADSKLSDEQTSYVNSVHRSGRLLLNLIEDVLDVAKIEAGAITLESVSFNPTDIFIEVIGMFAIQSAEKNIQIVSAVSPNADRIVIGDPARVRQILVNLMSNAVKFTDKGSVTLKAAARLNESLGQMDLILSVIDTGIGIPESAHARLFKRFSQVDSGNTRRYGGSGLGLMISRQLVTMMGGTIGIASEVGKGSTFTAHFPLKLSRSQAPLQSPSLRKIAPRHESSAPLTVLAIDDNDESRHLIGLFLKKLGHTFTLANSARDALAKFQASHFDIILMDIQMPEMDGYEATAVIRALPTQKSEVPIVALTANAMTGDSNKAFQAGMDDYLTKPIDIEALRALLNRWVVRLEKMKAASDDTST